MGEMPNADEGVKSHMYKRERRFIEVRSRCRCVKS